MLHLPNVIIEIPRLYEVDEQGNVCEGEMEVVVIVSNKDQIFRSATSFKGKVGDPGDPSPVPYRRELHNFEEVKDAAASIPEGA